jgi:hypothetical protein
MATSSKSRPARLLLLWAQPVWALVFAFVFYFLVSMVRGNPFEISKFPYFNYLADGFLHGQLNLHLIPPNTLDLVFFGGKFYIYWLPFPAVVMMPFVALFGVQMSDIFLTIVLGSINVALVALLLKAACQRGLITLDERRKAVLVVFFALGTAHFNMAPLGRVWFTSLVIGVMCVTLAYLAALSLHGWLAFFLVGVALTAAMGTRIHLIFNGIWLAWYLLREHWNEGFRRLVLRSLVAIAPVLVGGSLLMLYNYTRFGGIADVGLDYHLMGDIFKPDYALYGAFNLHYLPTNFYYQYLAYPFPVRYETYMGSSLFLLSPLFFGALWALWQDRRSWSTWLLFLSIVVVDIPILLLMGTGLVQFGPRYTLDFIIPFLFLTIAGIRHWPKKVIDVLVIISILYYLAGTFLLAFQG